MFGNAWSRRGVFVLLDRPGLFFGRAEFVLLFRCPGDERRD